MAGYVGTANILREQKKIIDRDLYDRVEVVSSANGVKGELYVPKALHIAAADTITVTVA